MERGPAGGDPLSRPKTLIFIPTFNERENVQRICPQIFELALDADLVVLDDNSPDGTGQLLDEMAAGNPRIHVIHRSGKLGIGSAHVDGIRYAYERGYQRLITMDCDFSHSPSDLPRFLETAERYDVTVGSRYMKSESLRDWNLLRKSLTNFGHLLTRRLLGIEFDATGAFRLYNIERIPREIFGLVRSSGYSFFFESLFVLQRNGYRIGEIPIVLPARTYGHSKMSMLEAARSGRRVFSLFLSDRSNPGKYRLSKEIAIDPSLPAENEWDSYWDKKSKASGALYELIAALYRVNVIRRGLTRVLRKHFPSRSSLLHAGCGSGQVDEIVQNEMSITAVDLSRSALQLYQKNNPHAASVRHASIFSLPFPKSTFDGVYNLGVIEHFNDEEIATMLSEVDRVLKPKGKLVLFWPHRRSSSVLFLKLVHWFLNDLLKKDVHLHPAEISHVRSRAHAEQVLNRSGFNLIDYEFGPRDGFVQAVVVGQKTS